MGRNNSLPIVLTLSLCVNFFLVIELYLVPREENCIFDHQLKKDLKFGQHEKGIPSEEEEWTNLLEFIRKNHLYAPSSAVYNLSKPNDDPMDGIFKKQLLQLLKQTKETGGIFIECGANDGEMLSNTLTLEKNHNWTGILIEANPDVIPDLFSKHRKAFIVDTCLSLTNKPQKLEFLAAATGGQWDRVLGHLNPEKAGEKISIEHFRRESRGQVQCLPLLAITQAAGLDHIDFFSLDIEGHELAVLKTLPFDRRLTIDVLTVEYDHIAAGKEALRSFMESKDYSTYFDDGQHNYIFVRKELNISPIK